MTSPEPNPAWDPTSPPPQPPTVPQQYPTSEDAASQYPPPPPPPPPAAPREPAPPEYSVGAASVPTSPFSPPDSGYDPSGFGAPGYGAPGYPATAVPSPNYGGYGGYGAQPGYGAQQVYYPGYPPPAKTNGLAIASMVVSIVGAVFLFCYGAGGLVGAVGAILGHVSRRQIRERQESGDGMALAGIITGWIATGLGLLIVAFFVIFIAWAVNNDPNLNGTFQNS
jgi:Domain of unknown function (DUF4190)